MQVVVTWGLRADGPAQVLQTHLPVWAEPGGSRNNPPVQGEGLGQLSARGRGGERGGESSLPPGGNGVGPAPCPREVRYQDALFLRPTPRPAQSPLHLIPQLQNQDGSPRPRPVGEAGPSSRGAVDSEAALQWALGPLLHSGGHLAQGSLLAQAQAARPSLKPWCWHVTLWLSRLLRFSGLAAEVPDTGWAFTPRHLVAML